MSEVSEIELLKAQSRAELNRLEADSTAKEVAGKAIGKQGLFYITFIVVIGVGIAGGNPKQERPEFEVMKQLIDKLDKLDREEQPMRVDVVGDKVTVTKGADKVSAARE